LIDIKTRRWWPMVHVWMPECPPLAAPREQIRKYILRLELSLCEAQMIFLIAWSQGTG